MTSPFTVLLLFNDVDPTEEVFAVQGLGGDRDRLACHARDGHLLSLQRLPEQDPNDREDHEKGDQNDPQPADLLFAAPPRPGSHRCRPGLPGPTGTAWVGPVTITAWVAPNGPIVVVAGSPASTGCPSMKRSKSARNSSAVA